MCIVRVNVELLGREPEKTIIDCELSDSLIAIKKFAKNDLDLRIDKATFIVYALEDKKEIYWCDSNTLEVVDESLMTIPKEELIKTLNTSLVKAEYIYDWEDHTKGFEVTCEFEDTLRIFRNHINDYYDGKFEKGIFSVYALRNNEDEERKLIYLCTNEKFEVINEALMELSKEELLDTLRD